MYLSVEEFEDIVDKHRNEETWLNKNGKWELRFLLK